MSDKKRVIHELATDTKFLYDRLCQVEEGKTISYLELNKHVGRNVQGEARSNLISARRKAANQDGIEFGIVRSVGLKRLSSGGIVRTSESYIQGSRRKARKGLKVLGNADIKALTNEERIQFNASASILGVIDYFGQPKQIRRIEAAVIENGNQLPSAKTIQLFNSK